jgi:hypothetical protein
MLPHKNNHIVSNHNESENTGIIEERNKHINSNVHTHHMESDVVNNQNVPNYIPPNSSKVIYKRAEMPKMKHKHYNTVEYKTKENPVEHKTSPNNQLHHRASENIGSSNGFYNNNGISLKSESDFRLESDNTNLKERSISIDIIDPEHANRNTNGSIGDGNRDRNKSLSYFREKRRKLKKSKYGSGQIAQINQNRSHFNNEDHTNNQIIEHDIELHMNNEGSINNTEYQQNTDNHLK